MNSSQDFDIFHDVNAFLDKSDEEECVLDDNECEIVDSPKLKSNSPLKLNRRNNRKKQTNEEAEVITIRDVVPETIKVKKPVPEIPITRKTRAQLNKLRNELKEIVGDNYNIIADPEPVKTTKAKRPRRKCTIQSTQPTIYLDTCPDRTSEIVNIDSDEFESSFDSLNYEVSIKIRWMGKIEKFTHRKHQKFSTLINNLAERVKENPRFVLLNLDEKLIFPDDTPDSIGYTISKFISGRIVKSNDSDSDENSIDIKIQAESLKKPLLLKISKLSTVNEIIGKCAIELKLKPDKIKLKLDGEYLDNIQQTVADLDFEGGELLDCVVIKK